jgi:hypothetical protein
LMYDRTRASARRAMVADPGTDAKAR